MAVSVVDIRSMLWEMQQCVTTYRTGVTMYRADAKIRDLFELIVHDHASQIAERVDESTLRADAELGVVAAPLIDLLLTLKARRTRTPLIDLLLTLKTRRARAPLNEDVDVLYLLAFVESVLRAEGDVAESPESVGPKQEFVRFAGGFRPFAGESDQSELSELLGTQAAGAVLDRLAQFAETSSEPSFGYVMGGPHPLASILIVPPRPDLEIVGDPWAREPEGEGVRRIYFGRFADETDGVRFLNMYYTLDTSTAA